MKMKKVSLIFCSLTLFLFIIACNNKTNSNQNKTNMETTDNNKTNTIFPLGERNSNDYFTGETYLQTLATPDKTDNYYAVGSVTFMPGARTNWHTHPSVQTLIVTEGEGWYQEKGKPAVKLEKGSVIPIPVGVEHWHGASKDSKLVHIAITNVKNDSVVTWMRPVNDEEYAEVNK